MSNSYIIAIDFGTAFSGYAFSLTSSQADINPHLKRWREECGLETPKTPTCILFDEHEEFLKFGYEAKVTYVKMRGEEAKKHYFFNCFKMSLYGKKPNRDLLIQAANGKSLKALKVFSAALSYMKDDALKTISANTRESKFAASDFTWVLTVPAIWDPSAKQFMREAATQAGIVTNETQDQLVIALEPEAASVWCKKLPADGFIAENQEENQDTLDQSPGTQYIVVDCGGGTIDITVHEVVDGGKLKELHKASGNDLGGQTVDRKFRQFLREIFGDVWDEYEENHPGELQRMMYDFTVLKKNDEDVDISCHFNLTTLAQKQQDIEKFFEKVQGTSWNDGSIKISKDRLKSFFDESLRHITNSLREILKKDLKIEYILLVGGYSESQILRRHVINQFHQYKVLCPFGAQEAIMKGAVMFGRNPEVVASRKSAFTYGFGTCERFDASRHRADKKFTNKEGEFCSDIFDKVVKIDDDVGWNESREYIRCPLEADQTQVGFTFYCTKRKNPKYVDEWGLEKIDSFVVPSPNSKHGSKREIKLEIRFGFTEMKATATDIDSGSKSSIKINFMTK